MTVYKATALVSAIQTALEDALEETMPVYRDSNKVPEMAEYVFVDQIDKVNKNSLRDYMFETHSIDVRIHLAETRSDLERVAGALEDKIMPVLYKMPFGYQTLKPLSYQSHMTDNVFHILVDYQYRVQMVQEDEDEYVMQVETHFFEVN